MARGGRHWISWIHKNYRKGLSERVSQKACRGVRDFNVLGIYTDAVAQWQKKMLGQASTFNCNALQSKVIFLTYVKYLSQSAQLILLPLWPGYGIKPKDSSLKLHRFRIFSPETMPDSWWSFSEVSKSMSSSRNIVFFKASLLLVKTRPQHFPNCNSIATVQWEILMCYAKSC